MKDIIIIIADPETGEVSVTVETETTERAIILLEATIEQVRNNLN